MWVLPRPDPAVSRVVQRLFCAVPPLRLALRGLCWLILETLSLALLKPRTAFWARALARRHLRKQVSDVGMRARLQAEYPIGCKRVALSSDYYPAMICPNVHLETTPIKGIEPQGVRLRDGRLVELGALVYAAGFRPMDVLAEVKIRGEAGESLAARWADRPRTANGVAVPRFPNLFFLLGPNTALGHNSVLCMIESQVRHVMGHLREMRRDGRTRIEATLAAESRFMEFIDGAFPRTA